MQKIAVVGAAGMLGGMLTKLLRERFPLAEVAALDIPEIDITDPACADSPGLADAEVMFNCAAYTAVDKAESEPEKAFSINATGVANLALAAKKHRSLLVHISTDFIFDGSATEPIPTDATPGAVSVYGKSKQEGERLLAESGAEFLTVRTAWLYGPGGHNFVEAIYKRAAAGEPLHVIDDQLGAPTYTADLADVMIGLWQAKKTGIFHCTNSGETTWCGFAKEIVRLSGFDAEVEAIPTSAYPLPAKRPAYSVLDLRKTEETLGRKLRPWQEALADYMRVMGRLL